MDAVAFAIRRAFYAIVKAAGLSLICIHDLRHTAGSAILQAGVNAKESKRLDHAKVAFRLDVFSHVLPYMLREAAAFLNDRLGGRRVAKGPVRAPSRMISGGAYGIRIRSVSSEAAGLRPL